MGGKKKDYCVLRFPNRKFTEPIEKGSNICSKVYGTKQYCSGKKKEKKKLIVTKDSAA